MCKKQYAHLYNGVILKKLIVLISSILLCGLASANILGTGPKDSPKRELPVLCKADEKTLIATVKRQRVLEYDAKDASEGVLICAGNSCESYYGKRSAGCFNPRLTTFPKRDASINELCSAPNSLCETATDWTGTSQVPRYPTCVVNPQTLEVKLFRKLTGDELKKVRCEKLDECLPMLSSRSDIRLAQQWQNKFKCE